MERNYEGFIETFNSSNTARVASSLKGIGERDYTNCTPIDLEQVVLGLKPNSPKAIITICYMMGLYARYLGNKEMYEMVRDLDRNSLWEIAKPNAKRKFISHSVFKSAYHDVGVYEEYNGFYQQTLFRCLYEGIYSDDMSVIKNLRASDIDGNVVRLTDDSGFSYDVQVSDRLAEDMAKLSNVNVWERKNRFGTCRINIVGQHEDSCFKVERRSHSSEYSYRFTYYRILRKIAKEYLGYNLLPLQLYVSGIMHRIGLRLAEQGIRLEDAFAANNKNRIVSKIIADELERSGCNTEVRNFREIVRGHLDVFME